MHGAPVTVHVTSPTRRLFSRIVRVVVMKPLMSSADATPTDNRSAEPTSPGHVNNLRLRMIVSPLFCCEPVRSEPYTPGRVALRILFSGSRHTIEAPHVNANKQRILWRISPKNRRV